MYCRVQVQYCKAMLFQQDGNKMSIRCSQSATRFVAGGVNKGCYMISNVNNTNISCNKSVFNTFVFTLSEQSHFEKTSMFK